MKTACVHRTLEGCRRVRERVPEKGETLPAVMQALGYPWLPGLITDLTRRPFGLRHPQGKEWFVVFEITYQPRSRPTGKLLIRPAVGCRLVPHIRLVENRPLSYRIVRRYLGLFLEKLDR